jgi:hypothetical protein
VSHYLINEILADSSPYSKYLNNKSVRKLIALCLIRDEQQVYEGVILNQGNLAYIDILLELFELPNPVEFFKRILSDNSKKALLQVYLTALLAGKPKKFKDFFVKVDSYNQGEIF